MEKFLSERHLEEIMHVTYSSADSGRRRSVLLSMAPVPVPVPVPSTRPAPRQAAVLARPRWCFLARLLLFSSWWTATGAIHFLSHT